VIAGGTLDPASKYLFKLTGTSASGSVSSSSVEVITRAAPFDGQLEVAFIRFLNYVAVF
jgi:hypothetical protein